MGARTAVFLDRDGTLIADKHYLNDPEAVELLDGAVDALRGFRERGHLLVLVSNQSGVARGLISKSELAAVHARLERELLRHALRFDGAYYCEHGPDDGCTCRKPAPGMLRSAAEDLGVDLGGSLMIGDKAIDVRAGRDAGCSAALLGDAALASACRADFFGPDWPSLLHAIPPTFAR